MFDSGIANPTGGTRRMANRGKLQGGLLARPSLSQPRMGIFKDVRFALRVLARKPGFTSVVVLTLALGIGAGSAMFSIIYSLLVRPVDLPELDRLAMIQTSIAGQDYQPEISPRGFLDYRADAQSFENVAAFQYWDVAISGNGDPEGILAFQTSPGFFDMLGVRPALGRWFAADEVDGQNERVVILGHGLWERRYGGDSQIVGKTITVDRLPYTVVGIMPKTFQFPSASELWAPLTLSPEQRADRGSHYLTAVAKLKPGVSLEAADAEMRQMGERHAAAYAAAAKSRLQVVSLTHGVTEDGTRNFIFTLLGAAIFVLLIACANVANLFLAHTLARRKELAVRSALGAGRGRVVRQLLTEATILGLIGGLASLLFAGWAVDAVKGALPSAIIRFVPGWESMGVDPLVLGFALAVGFAVGLIFGILPALEVSRGDVGTILKEEGRATTATGKTHRLRAVLVVGQIALALILLLGAGALTKAFMRFARAGTGMDPTRVLTIHVQRPDLPQTGEKPALLAFEERVVARLAALPGVSSAAVVNNVPGGTHNWSKNAYPEGRVVRPGEEVSVQWRPSTPGYLDLMRVPRQSGRGIEERDGTNAPRVAVVSELAARRLWPDESPIGKRLRFDNDTNTPWVTVVGVVGDVRDRTSDPDTRPTVYLPYAQEPTHSMTFVLRASGDALALVHPAQAAIFAVDPAQPVSEVRSLDMVMAERLSAMRIGSSMMAAFALLALALGAIGIYGVIATLVTQRTHEIGVRMALGAQRGDVLRLVVGKGVVLIAIGLVIGLAGGAAVLRLLASVLTGNVDNDLMVFVVFTVAVAAVALFGTLVPAWRATRVDPLLALRHD